jgi:hypothetical protein
MFVTDAANSIAERDSAETVASRINPEGFRRQYGIQINGTPYSKFL